MSACAQGAKPLGEWAASVLEQRQALKRTSGHARFALHICVPTCLHTNLHGHEDLLLMDRHDGCDKLRLCSSLLVHCQFDQG